MTIVTECLNHPHQVAVIATLWGDTKPVVGLHQPTNILVTSFTTHTVGASGCWSLDLPPNSEIEPANTVYRLMRDDICKDGREDYITFISVPATGGPYLAWDLQVPAPGPFPTWIGNLTVGNQLIVNGVNLTPTPLSSLPDPSLPLSGAEWLPMEQLGLPVKATSDLVAGKPSDSLWGVVRNAIRGADDLMDFAVAVTANAGLIGSTILRTNLSGTGTQISQSAGVGEFGVGDMTTGSTATGRCGIEPNITAFNLFATGNVIEMGARVKLPTVSTGSETWRALIGYGTFTSSAPADGFFFRSPAAAGNWRAVVRRGSADIADIDTGVATEHSNFHNFKVRWDPVNKLTFWIDGVKVAQETVNVPQFLDNISLPSVAIVKTLGSTARVLRVDAYSMNFQVTSRNLEHLP
jgi:hypothetical protein